MPIYYENLPINVFAESMLLKDYRRGLFVRQAIKSYFYGPTKAKYYIL